ncbi:MAG TPA: M28 family peptidase [Solirubrobacteraceae bacterium]
MGVAETIDGLSEFPGRGAGTNSERRAALWLAEQLRGPRRQAAIETFWSRPNWALAGAWHAGLAAVGSLVTVASPRAGGAVVIVALLSTLADGLTGVSLGRRLTRERASQNVVSPPPSGAPPIRLLITANYDAGRMGLVHHGVLRGLAARLRDLLGPLAVGWQGLLVIGCAWLLVTAVLRDGGARGATLAVLQLIPTAGMVLAGALLLELGSSSFGPAAGDNGSGTALALALTRALDAAPPRHLGVELLLQGAGDGSMLGLARHLRGRRHELRASNVIVLGLAACGAGHPFWWSSDGPLIPQRFTPRLVQLAAQVSAQAPEITARPHRGRGSSPAYPARRRGRPAITLGALTGPGLVPRSHLPSDTPDQLDTATADRLLALALMLTDAIDASLAGTQRVAAPAPPT